MPEFKVLLIEDDNTHAFLMTSHLVKGGIEVELASNLFLAEKLFNELRVEIDLIILDACLNPRHEVDTEPLLSKMLGAGFKGPIIASSSHEPFNERLMAAGATHQAPKWHASKLALQLLETG